MEQGPDTPTPENPGGGVFTTTDGWQIDVRLAPVLGDGSGVVHWGLAASRGDEALFFAGLSFSAGVPGALRSVADALAAFGWEEAAAELRAAFGLEEEDVGADADP